MRGHLSFDRLPRDVGDEPRHAGARASKSSTHVADRALSKASPDERDKEGAVRQSGGEATAASAAHIGGRPKDRTREAEIAERNERHARSRPPPQPPLKHELVETVPVAKAATATLLKKNVVAVDCEGVRLSRLGQLCLVQVASAECVYLFDIVKLGADAFDAGGLRRLLESHQVVKVLHDCRHDSDALYWQFNVLLSNVFDTQVAFATLRLQQGFGKPIPIGLATLLRKFTSAGVKEMEQKMQVKEQFNENEGFWLERPLSESAVAYAKFDVEHLISAYAQMKKYLLREGTAAVMATSAEYAASFRDNAKGPELAALEFQALVQEALQRRKEEDEKRESKEGRKSATDATASVLKGEGSGEGSVANAAGADSAFRFNRVEIMESFN